jgi:hypothetical protein
LLHRLRYVAALASVVAVSAISPASAHAAPTNSVYLTSPNGAAQLSGTITWYTKRHWVFSGWLKDTACNSHDVFVRLWVNERYSRDHGDIFGQNWLGRHEVGSYRNSSGCGVETHVYRDYTDDRYDDHDVDFVLCDDGFSDSCSSEGWPRNWYGVYHNPYTAY